MIGSIAFPGRAAARRYPAVIQATPRHRGSPPGDFDRDGPISPHHPSAAVRRLRRGLPMAVVAERAFTSRSTLQRVEAGGPAVSMGIYAATLQALGLLERLGQVADIGQDGVGQALATAALPRRARLRRAPTRPASPEEAGP